MKLLEPHKYLQADQQIPEHDHQLTPRKQTEILTTKKSRDYYEQILRHFFITDKYFSMAQADSTSPIVHEQLKLTTRKIDEKETYPAERV